MIGLTILVLTVSELSELAGWSTEAKEVVRLSLAPAPAFILYYVARHTVPFVSGDPLDKVEQRLLEGGLMLLIAVGLIPEPATTELARQLKITMIVGTGAIGAITFLSPRIDSALAKLTEAT